MVKKKDIDIFKLSKEKNDFLKLKEYYKKEISKMSSEGLMALTSAFTEWAKERNLL